MSAQGSSVGGDSLTENENLPLDAHRDGGGIGSTRRSDAGGHLLFALAFGVILLVLIWKVIPQVMEGEFSDPDDYMRMLRVERLVETGSWYDNSIPRSNAPFGEELHWTRPLDVLLVGMTSVALPFTSLSKALDFSAIVLPPLLLLLACFVLGWASLPLVGREYRYYTMIAVLAQVGVMGYSLPGRADHHVLLILLFTATFGLTLRWTMTPFSRAIALGLGAVVGLGLWVGTEFIIPLALVFLAGMALWLADQKEAARKNLWFALGLLGVLALALVAEHPSSRILETEYDRVSAPYLLMAALAFFYWAAVRRLEARGRGELAFHERLVVAVLGGGATLFVQYFLYPDFFRGPEANVEPRLAPIWREMVAEDRGLAASFHLDKMGTLLIFLGASLVCIPFLGWMLKKDRKAPTWPIWLLTATWLIVFIALALYRIRFVPYPEILLAVVSVAFLSRILPRFERIERAVPRMLMRAGTAALVLAGPMFLGGTWMIASGQVEGQEGDAEHASAEACPVSEMVDVLNGEALGQTTHTIAAHLDYGPEILYRTRHRVIGTPYHRNAEGILALFTILGDPDLNESRRVVEKRGVDLILICRFQAGVYGSGSDGDRSPTLHDLLLAGEVPDWLQPIPLDSSVTGGFLLYGVRR